MEELRLEAGISCGQDKYEVRLRIVQFEEDGFIILYSPALDMSGYGKTIDDAKNSLSVNLQEFFRYTNNKKTLSTVLTELGWSNKRKKVFTPPLDTKLAETNPTYADILNNKEYSMINQELELSY